MPSAILDLFQPLLGLMPEIGEPERVITLREKVIWSALTAFIFTVLGRVHLLGYWESRLYESGDLLYWTRGIVASDRGTLMELGFAPFMTACSIMHLLACAHIIEVDNNPTDMALFNKAQMLLAIVITALQGGFVVLNGTYGDSTEIGTGNRILVSIQLFAVGIFILLLESILSKGYGLGSAMGLFIAANVSWTIFWKGFGPVITNTGRGEEYYGAVPAFFHRIATRQDKIRGLREAVYRQNLPNLLSFLFTFPFFVSVIYTQVSATRHSTRSSRFSGQYNSYPVGLFYSSNMPIVLFYGLLSNLFLISEMFVFGFGNGNFVVRLLGSWDEASIGWGKGWNPTGGLCHYFKSPSLEYYIQNLQVQYHWNRLVTHWGIHALLLLGSCHSLSKLCTNRYISTFGILFVGALSASADVMRGYAPGMALMLAGTIIAQYIDFSRAG